MTLITIRNLGVTLSAPLFSRLNLVVNPGDRIGLVAANGRGKSTLLRCMAGTMEASEGEITRSRGLTVGCVEQNVPETLMETPLYTAVLEALSAEQRHSERWRVDVALESLEVPEALRQRPLKELSGGWQRLAMLARVLMTEADVLLLDEPTNHLDLTRISQLSSRAIRARSRWLVGSSSNSTSGSVTSTRASMASRCQPPLRCFSGCCRMTSGTSRESSATSTRHCSLRRRSAESISSTAASNGRSIRASGTCCST